MFSTSLSWEIAHSCADVAFTQAQQYALLCMFILLHCMTLILNFLGLWDLIWVYTEVTKTKLMPQEKLAGLQFELWIKGIHRNLHYNNGKKDTIKISRCKLWQNNMAKILYFMVFHSLVLVRPLYAQAYTACESRRASLHFCNGIFHWLPGWQLWLINQLNFHTERWCERVKVPQVSDDTLFPSTFNWFWVTFIRTCSPVALTILTFLTAKLKGTLV